MDFVSKNEEKEKQKIETTVSESIKAESDINMLKESETNQIQLDSSEALKKILESEDSVSIRQINTEKIDTEIKDSMKSEDSSENQISESKVINDIRNSVSMDVSDINVISKSEAIAKSKNKLDEVKSVIYDAAEYKKKRRQEKLKEGEKLVTITQLQIPTACLALDKFRKDLFQDTDSANKEFVNLKNAMSALMTKFSEKNCEGKEFSFYKEFYALREAAAEYANTHKGHRFSKKGKRRQKLANGLKAELDHILAENEILRDAMINKIDKSADLYSKENDESLLEIGKFQINTNDARANNLAANLTPETVRIARIIRQEQRCSAIITERLGKAFKPSTGMDERCLILGADHLFSYNSDGTPATKEDARILDKAVAYAEAFMDEDKTKRHKYLDELIQKIVNIPTDPKFFKPEKIMKEYAKYRELSLLMINYQNAFENDSYNLEYLMKQPESIQKRLKTIADINAPFTILIGNMVDLYGVKNDGTFKLNNTIKQERIEKMDEYDVILADKENTMYVEFTDSNNSYDPYVKEVMKNKSMVTCDSIREAINSAKISEDMKNIILEDFNANVNDSKYYCMNSSNVSLLASTHTLFYQYEEGRKNIPPLVNLKDARQIELNKLYKHLYVENEHEEFEKKLIDFYKWNYTGENHFLKDEKNIKAAIAIAGRYKESSQYFMTSEYRTRIKLSDEIIERTINGILKPVMKDSNGHPANEAESIKAAWNDKYLKSIADNDMESLQECVKDIIHEMISFPIDKMTDSSYMLEHMEQTTAYNALILRYSNINDQYPKVFEAIKEENPEEFKRIEDIVTVLSIWSSLYSFEVAEDNGIAFETANALTLNADKLGNPDDTKKIRDSIKMHLYKEAKARGIEIPGLEEIKEV